VLDQNRIVGKHTQSTYKFIINGKQLNLQEIFIYQMVVRSMQQLGSTVVFEGDDSQTIPESAFVNNTVASVIVNNLFGVITESDLIITNTLNLASPNPSDNKGGMDTGLKLLY
jgi:hypothetical protein